MKLISSRLALLATLLAIVVPAAGRAEDTSTVSARELQAKILIL